MKKLMVIAGILLSAVLLWFAIRDADFGEIVASFRRARVVFAAPLLLALAGFYYFKAARWSDMLSPTSRIRARELVPAMMSGAAGNNLLPAHMGELVRTYLLSREFRLSKSGVLATLVAERVFDIVGILVLLCGALLFADTSAGLRPAVAFLVTVAVAGSILMYLMVWHSGRLLKFLDAQSSRFSPVTREKLSAVAARIAGGFGALRDSGLFYRILLNSVLLWILMSGCVYFALQAFAIDVPYHAAIIVLAFIAAGLTLPTSPGFVGTIQYCFVLGLAPFGIDSSQALAASIFYHMLLWFSVTGTGLFFLHRYRLTFADIRRLEAKEAGRG